jgi:mRNA deadenylase 3'-5' endonuclease subunit Ccr4
MTYNVLAQALISRDQYPYAGKTDLRLRNRAPTLIREIMHLLPDVVCMQELDFLDTLMGNAGFAGRYGDHRYLRKPGGKHGLAVLWDPKVLTCLEYDTLVYEASGEAEFPDPDGIGGAPLTSGGENRRNVAQFIALRHVPTQAIIILSNTHLYWRPEAEQVKLRQATELAHGLARFRDRIVHAHGPYAHLLMCGDFNSTPDSLVYAALCGGRQGVEDIPLTAGLGRMASCYGHYQHVDPEHVQKFSLLNSTHAPEMVQRWKGEPICTNYTASWYGTLDYLWIECRASTPIRLLSMPDCSLLAPGLPNQAFGSDHVSLCVEVPLTRP